jgi:hypothetical protein
MLQQNRNAISPECSFYYAFCSICGTNGANINITVVSKPLEPVRLIIQKSMNMRCCFDHQFIFMRSIHLYLLFLFFVQNASAQLVPPTENNLRIRSAKTAVQIDGIFNEESWNSAAETDSLYNKWPKDIGKAIYQTRVKMMYDKNYLYIAVKAYTQKAPVIQTLKRDGLNYWLGDGVMLLLDPMDQRAQALAFAVNAGGAQLDGIMQPGIGINFDWDGKWVSAVKQYDDHYAAEIAIPFQTLRFKKGVTKWGLNIIRNDMSTNTFSTWTNVPVAFGGIDMGYLGSLHFEEGELNPRSNNVIIPYTTLKRSKDFKNNKSSEFKLNAGADAKIALNSSLNLDLTINPDFSQADVDRQVTNFDRFSLFFPERRNFFLENSDLFANFGTPAVRPFFSRRIGIDASGNQLPIIAGARLTGNLNPNLRIGLLNMQTNKNNETPATNYTVAAVERKFWQRSNVRFLFTNRHTQTSTDKNATASEYNRVAGGEFNYISANSNYNASIKYFNSFDPKKEKQNDFLNLQLMRIKKHWWLSAGLEKVGKNFIADAGFIPRLNNYDAKNDTTIRLGYTHLGAYVQYRRFPNNGKVNMRILEYWPNVYLNTNGSLNEMTHQLSFITLFADRREFDIRIKNTTIDLPFETKLFSEAGNMGIKRYNFSSLIMKYYSNVRKPFYYTIATDAGGFYNGQRVTLSGSINYRKQHWGNIGMEFSHSFIELNQKKLQVSLLSPTIEIAFKPTLFWTTFMQYNTQANNFNINSRFQWRFKPMSDLFIVYTDNYTTENFMKKNRGLILKLNYWLNL